MIVTVMKQRQPQKCPPKEKEVAVWWEVELLRVFTNGLDVLRITAPAIHPRRQGVRLFRNAKPRSRLLVLIRPGGTSSRLIGH